MAADYAFAFGDYVYGDVAGLYIEKFRDSLGARPRMAHAINQPGAFTAGSLLDTRKFSLQIILVGDDPDDLRDKMEAFRAAHAPGVPAEFYSHSDRYRLAEVSGIGTIEYDGMAGSQLRFTVDFTAADPYEYSDAATNTTGLASGGTVTTAGTTYSLPVFTMVVSSIGTDGTITVANTTTGESFILAPCATGTVVIDSRAETVTRSSVDVTHEMNGQFLRLAAGANTITVSTSGGATISSLSSSTPDRWN